jgi:PhnB protein
MLDENPEFQMIAPKPGDPKPIWFNIMVPDIVETFSKAISVGCTEVQPVTDMKEMGVSNAIFIDPFGYLWMLHQVHEEVSFEERKKIWEERKG